MDAYDLIKYQDAITSGEAILAAHGMVKRYNRILENIIRIKSQFPVEGEDGFSRSGSSHELLSGIQRVLTGFDHKISDLEAELMSQQGQLEQIHIEHWDDLAINKKLLSTVSETVMQLDRVYQDKAKSFANVLRGVEDLHQQYQDKLLLDTNKATVVVTPTQAAAISAMGERASKTVYVRLFHREMESLTIANESKSWIKPLLESVANSEKLGLAVYENEVEVKKSLKNDYYGYATLEIAAEQDITEQRGEKIDPQLNCRLLTLTGITLDNIVKFSYRGVDYPIIDGVLQLSRDNNEG